MIILTEVAQELELMLNGVSVNNSAVNSIVKSVAYPFKVATAGIHIDSVADTNKGENFIPVFIDSMGGEFNPVANLGEVDYNIPITIYYPVRFKDQFYALNNWLIQVFVGQKRVFGSNSAVCSISVAEYGEIQQTDFKAFADWTQNTFRKPIKIMEAYMSMSFNLYLSNANGDYMYGNSVVSELTLSSWTPATPGDNIDTDVTFAEASIQSNSEPAAEQLLGSNETQGLPVNTSYSTGFSCYIKNTPLYRYILDQWAKGNSQALVFNIKHTFTDMLDFAAPQGNIKFERTCFLQSVNIPITKGELLTLTFTFIKKV